MRQRLSVNDTDNTNGHNVCYRFLDELRLGVELESIDHYALSYQRYFKSAWKNLAEVPVQISSHKYITSIEKWTCNCGQQKYHPQHLCKHLVQMVPPPPLTFWRQIIRRRTAPLYRHPVLIPRDEDLDGCDGVSSGTNGSYYNPDDGSITDGDDHVWIGDPDVLMSGEWRDFDIQQILGKRSRSVMSTSVGDGLSSSAEQDMNEIHEQLNDPDESDLEHEVCQTHSKFRADVSLTLPFISKLQALTNALSLCADELAQAVKIIRSQLPHRNQIWMKSVVSQNLGGDISLLVKDIRYVEETGRRRDRTWARAGDHEGMRRSQNTMGYQVRTLTRRRLDHVIHVSEFGSESDES